MEEESKMMSRPVFMRGGADPFREWTIPSRLFNREVEFPPFLDERDMSWLDWARQRLAGSSWPGYTHAGNAMATTPGGGNAACPSLPAPPNARNEMQVTGPSEVRQADGSWRVSLEVNQFTPDDIKVKTKDGYLEITGKHEERQDSQGLVARSFNRKYKLPVDVDVEAVICSLSPGGVLSVEAQLPGTSSATGPRHTEEVIIPIQTQHAP
ncbi:heat shock protein beta-1-like [Engraulis encrasicolus]|uniref:heat shock protein beta-1-like n=1 Tax=Engraulis encrasicolus TaxID=184585 RepID=UPI002FD1B658